MKVKRQKSGSRRYWALYDGPRYVGCLGPVRELGDPPVISLEAAREFCASKGLALEELQRVRRLTIAPASPQGPGGKAEDDTGPNGGNSDGEAPQGSQAQAQSEAEDLVWVRFVGRGSYLLNEIVLFHRGDVKAVPRWVWEERLRHDGAFELA